MTRSPRRAALAAVLMAGTALGGFAAGHAATAETTQPPAAAITVPPSAQPALPNFADMVARVRPAVVTITSTERVQQSNATSPFPPGSPPDRMFRRYFGMPGMGGGGTDDGGQAAGQPVEALGSGFLVDADGHVVTNNHVVANASRVTVTLDNGQELPARIVGRDPRTDVAVLKVDAGKPLPFLQLGDSDKARPGDWVVAMGNPFGLGGTVTAGIVSARNRDIHAGPYDDFLQVDAPINRGNSGGPLFSTDGSVLGVNTAIFSPSGGSVGIGFAIPSNLVKQVVAQLEAHGHIERGFLGVMTQPVDGPMASALNLPRPEGALVADVQPNEPAAAAGLKPGDVITAVDGKPVEDPRALARMVAALQPGTSATLTVHRDGSDQQIPVKTAELPDKTADASGPNAGAGQASGGKLGLALAPLDRSAREQLGLGPNARGAVIEAVRPNSPAADAGLRPGDVVQGVAGQPVASPEDAIRAIQAQEGAHARALALRVLRDGHSTFVAVPVGQG